MWCGGESVWWENQEILTRVEIPLRAVGVGGGCRHDDNSSQAGRCVFLLSDTGGRRAPATTMTPIDD